MKIGSVGESLTEGCFASAWRRSHKIIADWLGIDSLLSISFHGCLRVQWSNCGLDIAANLLLNSGVHSLEIGCKIVTTAQNKLNSLSLTHRNMPCLTQANESTCKLANKSRQVYGHRAWGTTCGPRLVGTSQSADNTYPLFQQCQKGKGFPRRIGITLLLRNIGLESVKRSSGLENSRKSSRRNCH